MNAASDFARLPYGVGKMLDTAIARVRRLRLLRGLAVTGIVALLAIAAVMAVDSRLVILDDRIRAAMTLGACLLTSLAAFLAVVRPLRRPMDLVRMARSLDARHPEFEERLSTLVELAGSDAGKIGFSASLYALVGDLAEGDVAKIDLARDFPARAAKLRLGILLALLLSLVGGVAVSPDLVGRLFLRAVAPWMDVGNLFSKDITVKPGDLVILSGSVIRIEAASAKGNPLAIRLSRKTRHGWSDETSEEMAGGAYETTADLAEREWRYRVTAGPAVTRYYYVRVSEMPKYERFTARVDYPSYACREPLVVSNADVGAIRAIQGSRVTFDVAVSDPGTLADFRIGGQGGVWEHVMVSNRTSAWSLDLVNADGFRAEKGRFPLTSLIDQSPSVVIEKPTGTLRLPPHAKIPVEITASDDVGVTSVYLRVSIDGEPWARHYGTHLKPPANATLYRNVADVDLSLYDLIFAQNVRFDVVAEDACPPEYGGPHAVTSTPFTVVFNANESSYAMQELKKEVADARSDMDEARRRLNDAQNLAREVGNELRRSEKVSEATEKKGERLAHEMSEAEKRIEELRNRFLSDERFAALARPMDRLLDEALKPLVEQVENAQFRERTERAAELDRATPEMRKAYDELDDLTKRLTERAERVDALEKARDVAARQEALARTAREILAERPTDTAKLEAWKRLEEAAMRKVDELARSKADADFAEARRKMETAAREMAQLKGEIDAAKAKAEREKQEAAHRESRRRDEAVRAESERQAAAADQKRAEEALGRKDARAASSAQQSALSHLERAEALSAVKEFQRRAAREATIDAQREASAALGEELALREAIAKGEKKADALDALDDSLRRKLRERRAGESAPEVPKETPQDKARSKALEDAAAEQAKASAALETASSRRSDELAARRAGNEGGAGEAAKRAAEAERQAESAQRAAEDGLQRGAALEGVNALQKAATQAAREARKRPRSNALAASAVEAQQAAANALREEKRHRGEIERGRETAADLEAFDRACRLEAAAREAATQKLAEAATPDSRRNDAALGELRNAVNSQRQAADALKRAVGADEKSAERFSEQASSAQRAVEDRLERAGATEAVKALQKLASEATRNARKAPRTREKAEAAVAAQQAANEAVRRELAVREAIQKGNLTDEDLTAIDAQLKEGLLAEAAKRTAAAEAAAREAVTAAKDAIGSDDETKIGELATAAFEARRDAVAAALAESRLRGDEARARALQNRENELDREEAAEAEAEAREKQILALQQSAADALGRNDGNRATNLQREIARAQGRAAEAVAEDDAAEARETAIDAQEEAAEATGKARRKWTNESRDAAVAAQKEAIEREREAQTEARATRALGRIRAADEAYETPESAEGDAETEAAAPARAAREAADAMHREVNAQASALGMSPEARQEREGGGEEAERGEDERKGGGGGVSSEVKALASELKRNDRADFFKSLFSRQGWFKIRGISKDGLGTTDLKDVPLEYRDLVRRYFLRLAEEGVGEK